MADGQRSLIRCLNFVLGITNTFRLIILIYNFVLKFQRKNILKNFSLSLIASQITNSQTCRATFNVENN